jgi:uncharacterized protein YoaH (UPF0181 family)
MKEEAKKIQDFLELTVSSDPAELIDRISQLMVYMARSGEMLAMAKRNLRARKTSEISKTIISIAKEQCLSATVQNALLDSICEEESFLTDWLERINRTSTHQIDALRSLLSYEKEQMKL